MQTQQTELEERLPWHMPTIQRLIVSLNTGNEPGSGEDEVTLGELAGQ